MTHTMKMAEQNRALQVAVEAAHEAGSVMKRNFHSTKTVNSATQHDIKLELDVRCQDLIQRRLMRAFPDVTFFGEEGSAGPEDAPHRWVVDPIDGTVNFTYGIPHACVSIALQTSPQTNGKGTTGETIVGVVYDPFCDELWTAIRGRKARLNNRVIQVSDRSRLRETIISVGFGKREGVLKDMLPVFATLTHRVRKIRIMGSAALALTYVASGRLDAFLECGLNLWDIAAGGLILECAGGEFWHQPLEKDDRYEVKANNGRLRRTIERCLDRENAPAA